MTMTRKLLFEWVHEVIKPQTFSDPSSSARPALCVEGFGQLGTETLPAFEAWYLENPDAPVGNVYGMFVFDPQITQEKPL